jgi:flagellar biosynthesis anti-sigma factor FlgM
MKVENNQTNRLTAKQAENSSPVDKSLRAYHAETRPEGMAGKDKASFSEQARLLAKAHTTLEETPEVRAQQVEELKNQIQAGNYEIPIEKLAGLLTIRLKELDL